MNLISTVFLAFCLFIITSCGGGGNNQPRGGNRCALNLKKESFNPKLERHNPLAIEFKGSNKLVKVKLEKNDSTNGLPVGELKYLNSTVYIVDQLDPDNQRVMYFEHKVNYNKKGELEKEKDGTTQDSFSTKCIRGFKVGQTFNIAEYDLPTNITVGEDGAINIKTRTISISFGKSKKNQLSFEDPKEPQESTTSLKEFFLKKNQMYASKPSTKTITNKVGKKEVKIKQLITPYRWQITLKDEKKLKAFLRINYEHITEK